VSGNINVVGMFVFIAALGTARVMTSAPNDFTVAKVAVKTKMINTNRNSALIGAFGRRFRYRCLKHVFIVRRMIDQLLGAGKSQIGLSVHNAINGL
jgi:hypothetical protein